jgi:hypothetical protein
LNGEIRPPHSREFRRFDGLPTMSNWYEPTKRKVYFAFRFADIMRVNNVRQSGKIGMDEQKNPRDFYDRSQWEKKSMYDPESLKSLMRGAVHHSSVVCVLVGTDSWQGRWLKYEIARAVIDEKGLLSVGINGLPHVDTRLPDNPGLNPLSIMGVYEGDNGRTYLAEQQLKQTSINPVRYDWQWLRYDDFTAPVTRPSYLPAKTKNQVTALSQGTRHYDYMADRGVLALGSWVDAAAKQVGR